MPTSGQGQSMFDSLQRILSDIAQAMTLPDADLDFLTQLQMGVTDYIRQGQAAAAQPSQPQSAVPGGMGNGPGMGMPPGGGMPGPPPGMMTGGASMGIGQPNMDEMKRLMATLSGGQGG